MRAKSARKQRVVCGSAVGAIALNTLSPIGLAPITHRSRDNLPNPIAGADPYKPVNTPAAGDLMDLFHFTH